MIFPRHKQIAFMNNKWWVGKTTLLYNIAHKFASKWYKVCMVDLDPQTNLTLHSFWVDHYYNSLFSWTRKTIYNVLEWILKWWWDIDWNIQPEYIKENLYLIPWDYRLSYYENFLITGNALWQASSWNQIWFFQLSPIYRYINQIWLENNFDIMLIDLSPSLWMLNRMSLLWADYFVVPLNTDMFSVQWIENLGKIMTEWKRNWNMTAKAVAGTSGIPYNQVLKWDPLFLWYIVNDFNIYSWEPIQTHQNWMTSMPAKIKENLSENMCKNWLVNLSFEKPLWNTKDYWKIVSKSQELTKPIFELTNQEINQIWTIENRDKAINDFEEIFNNISERIAKWE